MKRVPIVLGTAALLALACQPSSAKLIDLTGHGLSGTSNSGYFLELDWNSSTGSGYIDSFVRIQDSSSLSPLDPEEGYKTDSRPLELDENTSATFTHSLLLSDVPTVNISGVNYKEFVLDLNETKGDKGLLSLDRLEIWTFDTSTAGGTANPKSGWNSATNRKYALGSSDWIALNYNLHPGSGKGDIGAYIPVASFNDPTLPYVYLYSAFGIHSGTETVNNDGHPAAFSDWTTDDGYEEWAVRTSTPPVYVPEPASCALLGLALAGLGAMVKRRKR